MEQQPKVKCPRCGSENVIIQNRGYSLMLGIGISCMLVVAEWIYTIYVNRHSYGALDDAGQFGFTVGLLLKSVVIFFLGLFTGHIGKNKLVARCLKCKCNFDPALGISEPEDEKRSESEAETETPAEDNQQQ